MLTGTSPGRWLRMTFWGQNWGHWKAPWKVVLLGTPGGWGWPSGSVSLFLAPPVSRQACQIVWWNANISSKHVRVFYTVESFLYCVDLTQVGADRDPPPTYVQRGCDVSPQDLELYRRLCRPCPLGSRPHSCHTCCGFSV